MSDPSDPLAAILISFFQECDELLEQLKVPTVHVSYDKLFFDADETADEWMKIFRFLGVGPQKGLTLNDIRHATTFAATSNRDHRATLKDYDTIAMLLRGTEFEGLLRSDGSPAPTTKTHPVFK